MKEPWIDRKEAMKHLGGISYSTLRRWVSEGLPMGNKGKFLISELDAWLRRDRSGTQEQLKHVQLDPPSKGKKRRLDMAAFGVRAE